MPSADAAQLVSRPTSLRAGWYAVGVLWFAYICSFVDRQVLALLVDPIKSSLAIGDTALSLLQGLAFGLFYSLMGLPCGAMVDRWSRRIVIASGVAVWSLATVACGFAGGFWSLFAARMLVGIGEAVLSPGALSLLSDHFPREKRVLAMSVYLSAASVGGGLAMIAGGAAIAWAAAHPMTLPGGLHLEGWRASFVLVGVPGLLVALALLTVPEPPRGRGDAVAQQGDAGWGETLRFMLERRTLFLRHYGGLALFGWVCYSITSWVPTWFVRAHGWTLPEVGWRYGAVYLVLGSAGAICGVLVAGRLRRRHPQDAALRTAAIGITGLLPFAVVGTLIGDPWVAVFVVCVGNFFMAFTSGTSVAAISEVTPAALRGRVAAVYYLTMTLVGLTAGPLSVALCTDYLFRDPARVGDSIALVCAVVGPFSVWITWRALPEFRRWALPASA